MLYIVIGALLAGWFSAVVGFEISHTAGNVSLILCGAILGVIAAKQNLKNR